MSRRTCLCRAYLKDERPTKWWASLSGGSRIRTYDLWVMSPTSYLCSIPRCFVYVCKGSNFFIHLQIFRHLFSHIPFSFIIITCSTSCYTLKFFHRRFHHAPHTRLKSRTRQQFTLHFFCSKTCCWTKNGCPSAPMPTTAQYKKER